MREIAGFLHRIRDGLLLASSALERGDDEAAAAAIEEVVGEIREELAK